MLIPNTFLELSLSIYSLYGDNEAPEILVCLALRIFDFFFFAVPLIFFSSNVICYYVVD